VEAEEEERSGSAADAAAAAAAALAFGSSPSAEERLRCLDEGLGRALPRAPAEVPRMVDVVFVSRGSKTERKRARAVEKMLLFQDVIKEGERTASMVGAS